MSDAGPEQIAITPPRRRRWLRRELWFVVGAVVLIALVALLSTRQSAQHTAPGRPFGQVPSPAAATPSTPAATPPATTPPAG